MSYGMNVFGVLPAGSIAKDASSVTHKSASFTSVSSHCSDMKLWAVTEEHPGAGETPQSTPTAKNLGVRKLHPEEPDEAWHSDSSTQAPQEHQSTSQDHVLTAKLAIPKTSGASSGTSSLAENGDCIKSGTDNSRARRESLNSSGRRFSLVSSMSMESTDTMNAYRSPLTVLRDWRRYWKTFTFFGVNQNDETPSVWGNRMNSMKEVGLDSRSGLHKTLSKMVSKHAHQDEMRLQLRDQRISLNYLDVFDTDGDIPGKWTIRVFSIGATILEYIKIFAGIWTFVLSFMVVAFWDVLHLEDDSTPTYLWFDLALDLLYVTCLVYQLRTSILDVQTGREYCSRRAIHARNFFSRWFWFDILSCIPLIAIVGFTSSTFTRLIAGVKSLRGWRIFRTPPEHLFVPSTSFQLFQLAGFIMMGGHLIACLWFTLVHEVENTMMHHSPTSEPYKICLEDGSASCLWELYTVSINQGIYLLMGIECNAYSAWEHFFVTVCAPLGALVHAYMLGRIILLIQRKGTLETKKNEHTMAIQEAMRTLDLPPDLQMRIVTFFTYERIHRSGRLFQELFEDLSPQLRFELQLHLYLELVGKSQLFRKTKPRVIREIVMSLNDIIFLPGDWVCRLGDYGDSMYFIVSGECSVIGQDTVTELKVLKRQDYFGEVALLTGVARTASVRANRFCIMAHLTKDNFAPIVQKWPDEMDSLLVNVENHTDRMKIKSEAAKLYGLSRRHSMASEAFNPPNNHTVQAFGAPNIVSAQAWRETKNEHVPMNGESKELKSGGSSLASVQPDLLGPLSLISNSNAVDDIHKSLKKLLHNSPDLRSIPDTKANALPHDMQDVSRVGSRGSLQHGAQAGAVDVHKAASTTNNEALQYVQSQLNQVGARVRQLHKDLVDQRSILKNDLAAMRSWAVETTKEALSHEVRAHDLHEVRSRRQSMHSVLSTTNSVAGMLLTPVT